MDMIGHYFHAEYGVPVVALLLFDKCLESLGERVIKNFSTVLGTPNDVVLATVYERKGGMVRLIRLLKIHLISPLDRMLRIYHKRSFVASKKTTPKGEEKRLISQA
jgi:hypothetical protein